MRQGSDIRRFASIGLAAFALVFGTRAAAAQEPDTFGAMARRLVQAGAVDATRTPERVAFDRLYQPVEVVPYWSIDGAPTRQALRAIEVLSLSDIRGLPAASYDVDGLRALAAALPGSPTDVARFDVSVSRSVIRLLADLHMGRVDPRAVKFDLPSAHDRIDLATLAREVSRAGDVAAAVASAEPPYVGYAALRRLLTRYRALATDTALRPPARAARSVRPGERYADVAALRRLLIALGDLDTTGLADPGRVPNDSAGALYDGALVDAMMRFQRRHGLDGDGIIGAATMAQLRVPLARRVRQIELTLERWRWLPDRPPPRYAVVNIPAFRLYAFEQDSIAQRPVLAMDVIVGQAQGRHGTPVFAGTMREVVFRPYWDVPPRIARNELIPLFRRRPNYFASEEFEIVRVGDAGDAAGTYPPTAANLARVAAGELRVRQRPGTKNALGFVKFVFPNSYNVFMHGTPAQELFARARRDFSHGCIRLEEPTALAELVLRDQPPWDRQAIEEAMQGEQTRHVPLARPWAVYVLYATAVVDDAGVAHFYPDLYGHDAALARALNLPPLVAAVSATATSAATSSP